MQPKRVNQVCRELNIPYKSLVSKLNKAGLKTPKMNTKLDPISMKVAYGLPLSDEEAQGVETKKSKKQERAKNPNQVRKIEEVKTELPEISDFGDRVFNLILEHDGFENREEKEIEYNGEIIKSIFSDDEAFTICSGMKESFATKLYRRYVKNRQEKYDIYKAHEYAMITKQKIGNKALSFLLNLPPLPFKAVNADRIFTSLNKAKLNKQKPFLSFLDSNNERYRVMFSTIPINNNKSFKRIDNELIVRNMSKGKNVGKLYPNGVFVPNEGMLNKLTLGIFIEFSEDPQKFAIKFGHETGSCAYCGRLLTDARSIKYGYGPVCARNESLPWY